MTQRSSQFILFAVTALSLSAYSFAFGRGGGAHVGGGAHEHARPEQRAPETATQANHENPVENNRAENNNNREQEVLRHDIVNPYVNRGEANRYDAAYWNREGYWGWGGFGGDGWTTNSPPTNVQPATP